MFTIMPLLLQKDGTYPAWLLERIIGRAMSNAAPFDMLDIQIQRQSM
jgi:hypothetical protein